MDHVKDSEGRMTRRAFLANAAAAAGGSILLPAMLSHAQERLDPGKPIPPLLFESFSESMTIEAARLYVRELARIGIRLTHRPMAFPAFLGKVYFEKNFTLGMGGFGAAVERIDPDFWIRSLFHSKGGFNISGYSNPEYDRLAEAQERELDPAKRKQLIVEAQRIHARALPSWWVIGRPMVNPVNSRRFTFTVNQIVAGSRVLGWRPQAVRGFSVATG